MRHAPDGLKVAGIDGFVRKPIKEGAHALLIRGADGSVPDAEIFLGGLGRGDFRRVKAGACGDKDLIAVQNLFIFGALNQSGPVIGVRNVDEGLSPLPERTELLIFSG